MLRFLEDVQRTRHRGLPPELDRVEVFARLEDS
jgi:hypothetical protein